jgi:hypothetical protein
MFQMMSEGVGMGTDRGGSGTRDRREEKRSIEEGECCQGTLVLQPYLCELHDHLGIGHMVQL